MLHVSVSVSLRFKSKSDDFELHRERLRLAAAIPSIATVKTYPLPEGQYSVSNDCSEKAATNNFNEVKMLIACKEYPPFSEYWDEHHLCEQEVASFPPHPALQWNLS